MIAYAPVTARERRLLACLAAAEVHPPSDYDLTTTDLYAMHPKDVSRKSIVSALRALEGKDYVSSGTERDEFGGNRLVWKITTRGLRVAFGVLA